MFHSIRARLSSLLDSVLRDPDAAAKANADTEKMTSAPTPPLAYERAVAEAAVLRAAILTKKVQSSVKEVSKEDKSPVTAADFAAQALLIAPLRALFPNDAFVGEEDSAQLRSDDGLLRWVFDLVSSAAEVQVNGDGAKLASPANAEDMLSMIDLGGRGTGGCKGRFWVMDPVDGTKTFLRGQQYAVSLSLIEDGQEVVGVLCLPNLRLKDGRVVEDSVDTDGLGIMLSAVRGQGVYVRQLSSSPILPPPAPVTRLQSPADLKDLHIVDSRNSAALRHDVIQDVATKFGAQYPGTEVWSSHMRYASLIVGGADAQIRVPCRPDAKVCIWDHAGAQLIFTEIGGKITDLDGRPINFGVGRELSSNRGMIVAREGVHGKILSAVAEILKA